MRSRRAWVPAPVVGVTALASGGWLLQRGGSVSDGVLFQAQLFQAVHRYVADRCIERIAEGLFGSTPRAVIPGSSARTRRPTPP
ncbi:MAG: hypothetical protein ACE5JR_03220 [Gemmatimonadota bacterium]